MCVLEIKPSGREVEKLREAEPTGHLVLIPRPFGWGRRCQTPTYPNLLFWYTFLTWVFGLALLPEKENVQELKLMSGIESAR